MLKKQITLSVLLLTFLTNVSFADTSVSVNKDQPAPFAGVLMDGEKAAKVHVQLMERDLYKELSDSYQTDVDKRKTNDVLTQQKISLLQDDNTKLADQLRSVDKVNNVERILIFTLGIAATILAGSLVNKISKGQ